MRNILYTIMPLVLSSATFGQLSLTGATLKLEQGAIVEIKGNLLSTSDLNTYGKIVLNGNSLQEINVNNKSISNIEIDNTNSAILTSNLSIGKSITFSNGKIILNDHNLTLSDSVTTSGQGDGKFIETNATGQCRKFVKSDISAFEIPVGFGSYYHPTFVTTNGTYDNALVAVQSKGTAHPNRPSRSTDYLNCYWSISQSGITGTVRASGKYDNFFVGNEADLKGITFSNGEWDLTNAGINTTEDTAGALIPPTGADLYAMNRFVYLKEKVFLQGAYNTATGLMNDNLRTLASFPSSDPYRTAPYNAYFTHTANPEVETISSPSTVLGVQPSPNDNIVDWVFLELRNATASPGNSIVQTRSALLQRDGDVVDVDGVSPVYFKNQDPGNYTIAVRHRNHLGLSTDPASSTVALTEKSTTPLIDMTTATDAQLFGSANVNYAVVNGKNMLYAGNVSGNGVVRYQGTNGPGPTNVSDRVALLSDLGNNELNTLNTYQRGDVSMNGVTRYQGTNGPGANNVSDRVFILGTVLGNNEIQTKTQALPN